MNAGGPAPMTQEEAQARLRYDPVTGEFWWIGVTPGGYTCSGKTVAGCLHPDGYIEMRFGRRLLRAASLAWLYVHGEWAECMDHINRDRADNRLANLRPATRSENQCNRTKQSNNTSGFKGVLWDKQNQKWMARASLNGKQYFFGRYDTPEEAGEAARVGRAKLHGDFTCD